MSRVELKMKKFTEKYGIFLMSVPHSTSPDGRLEYVDFTVDQISVVRQKTLGM